MNNAGFWKKDWCLGLAFEDNFMAQLLYKIANEPAPHVLAINPKFSPAFVAFLEKVVAKNSDERYQTGEQFAAALRASMGSAGAVAGATTGVDISL